MGWLLLVQAAMLLLLLNVARWESFGVLGQVRGREMPGLLKLGLVVGETAPEGEYLVWSYMGNYKRLIPLPEGLLLMSTKEEGVGRRGRVLLVSTTAVSILAVSVDGKIAKHSRRAGVSSHLRISKQHGSGALQVVRLFSTFGLSPFEFR